MARELSGSWTALSSAILDQALFSAVSLATSILLARWMTPEAYGAHASTASLFLLASGVHNVLVIEPFSINGPNQGQQYATYVATVRRAHWALCAFLTLAGLVGTVTIWAIDRGPQLPGAMLGMTLAQGPILYFWLQRRSEYLTGNPIRPILGTALMGLGAFLGLAALHHSAMLSPFTAYVAVGLMSLLAAWIMRVTQTTVLKGSEEPPRLGVLLREHWEYGRWLLVAMALYWCTTSVYQVAVGAVLSLSEAASLKALQNVTSPVTQLITALSLVFMPWLSTQFMAGGRRALERGIMRFTLIATGTAVLYSAIMWFGAAPLFAFLYGDQYAEDAWLLPYYALWAVIPAATTGWLIGLRVLRETRQVFKVDALGALLTLTIGVWLIGRYGLPGAVAGTIVSSAARCLVLPRIWRHATAA